MLPLAASLWGLTPWPVKCLHVRVCTLAFVCFGASVLSAYRPL